MAAEAHAEIAPPLPRYVRREHALPSANPTAPENSAEAMAAVETAVLAPLASSA